MKSGIQCFGYSSRVAILFEPPTGPKFASNTEKISFDFLLREGSRVLSIFQENTMTFWAHLAPQITTSNRAVYHAFVALGSLQRPLQTAISDCLRDVPMSNLNVCALEHLGHAFREFAQSSKQVVPLEVSLSCSILFLAIQIWVEQTASVSLHTTAALRFVLARFPSAFAHKQEKLSESWMPWISIVGGMVNHAAAYADDFHLSLIHI